MACSECCSLGFSCLDDTHSLELCPLGQSWGLMSLVSGRVEHEAGSQVYHLRYGI
jgi:hypothetical protein